MESATENIPPMAGFRHPQGWQSLFRKIGMRKQTVFGKVTDQVRLKWRGKSSPRARQREWQGKPHPEQDQIGRR